MPQEPSPSFSVARKWNLSLNAVVTSLTVLALVLMVNYLAARHFTRRSLYNSSQVQLSPLTLRILNSLTNDVKVIIYFDTRDPLYDSVRALLKQYSFLNSRIKVETSDYETDPGANLIKSRYNLMSGKDMVIFDCRGQFKLVPQNDLSDLDLQPLISGQSREVQRTHFKGEAMFTSAILNVTSTRSLKAYFLKGHGEHSPEDRESEMGYTKFAEVLKQNNIDWSPLSLLGTNEIPMGNLLIAAAPADPLPEGELNKIDQYLKNGGRMLVLFDVISVYKNKSTGLENILSDWGVEVGKNIVRDKPNSPSRNGHDLAISAFGNHPIVAPLYKSRLHVVDPRSIRKLRSGPGNADAPNVTELFFTGPDGTVVTDIQGDVIYEHPTDLHTNVCLAVAVEKGKIKNVSADRGTTRIVVVGDSLFWGNQMMDSAANRDFAFLAVNWLLDRSELLSIPAQPIKKYKLIMTESQLSAVRWLLLGGMPGAVLLLGLLVWVRRRH